MHNNIEANIVKDSLINGKRVTTFYLVYPRVIHPHLLTHRVFSRNSVSTRAISEKRIGNLLGYKPLVWRKEKKGMSSKEVLNRVKSLIADGIFYQAKQFSRLNSYLLYKLGVHKEQANDLVSPYMYIKTLVTATEFENFFNLRADQNSNTRLETYHLAKRMQVLYEISQPIKREIHIPFSGLPTNLVDDEFIFSELSSKLYLNKIKEVIKESVVKSARLSFGNEFRDFSPAQNDSLFDHLIEGKHLSPFEHIVMTHNASSILYGIGYIDGLNGNLADGVVQLRKVVEKLGRI